jgi:ribosomal protein S18 acetylase RimI-like enzyme
MSQINTGEITPQALYREEQFYQRKNEPTDELGLLRVCYGLTDKVVGKYSSDARRFKDRASYDKWFAKGRSIYSMVDGQGKLLGIIWFGASSFPEVTLKPEFSSLNTADYSVTFALRIYDEARGHGIAKKLTAAASTAYLSSEDYQEAGGNGIWLETSEENGAAVKTYSTLFTQVSEPDEQGRIVMVLNPRKQE